LEVTQNCSIFLKNGLGDSFIIKHRFQPEAIHTKGNVLYNHLLKPARLMFDYDHSHSGDRAKSLTEIAVTKCFVPLLKSDLAVTVEV